MAKQRFCYSFDFNHQLTVHATCLYSSCSKYPNEKGFQMRFFCIVEQYSSRKNQAASIIQTRIPTWWHSVIYSSEWGGPNIPTTLIRKAIYVWPLKKERLFTAWSFLWQPEISPSRKWSWKWSLDKSLLCNREDSPLKGHGEDWFRLRGNLALCERPCWQSGRAACFHGRFTHHWGAFANC